MRLPCAWLCGGLLLVSNLPAATSINWNERGSRPRVQVEKHRSSRSSSSSSSSTATATTSSSVSTPPPRAQTNTSLGSNPAAEAERDRQLQRDAYNRQLDAALQRHAEILTAHEALDGEWSATSTRLAGLESQLRHWSNTHAEIAVLRDDVERLESRLGMPSFMPAATLGQSAQTLRSLAEKARPIAARLEEMQRHRAAMLRETFQTLRLESAPVVDDRSGLGRRIQAELQPHALKPDGRAAHQALSQSSEAPRPIPRALSARTILVPASGSLDWDRLEIFRKITEEGAQALENRRMQLHAMQDRMRAAAKRLRAVDATGIQSTIADLRSRRDALLQLDQALNGDANGYAGYASRIGAAASEIREAVRVAEPSGKESDLESLFAARHLPARAIDTAIAKWEEAVPRTKRGPRLTLPDGPEVINWTGLATAEQVIEKLADKAGPHVAQIWSGISFARFYPAEVRKLLKDQELVLSEAARAGAYGSVDEVQELVDFSTAELPLKIQLDVVEQLKSAPLSWFLSTPETEEEAKP